MAKKGGKKLRQNKDRISRKNKMSSLEDIKIFGKIEEEMSKSKSQKDYSDYKYMSEKTYNDLASSIIQSSIYELFVSANSKRRYKVYLTCVFSILLVVFMFLLFWLVFNEKKYDNKILTIYISSLMVEVVLTVQMFIKLVFDNSYQTRVIEILHKFLENFQKM
ncbi:MAG: hypothetical protein IJP71_03040 [Lachnospiraceae bacterium]|nr:hypothetical protein [Lachnospiraceae bacterium]